MGNLAGDGKAVDVTCPAGDLFHGDLYRISGWTGFLLDDCLTAETDRARSMEVAWNRKWEIKMPAGLTPAVGDLLSWSTGVGTFKRGDTDLVANSTAGSQGPVVKVLKAKNAAGYATVMIVGQGSEAHA